MLNFNTILIILIAFINILFFCISLYPPHLPQEIDFLNYHGTLPKQHHLHGFWLNHLSWSSADLWPQAIQWILWPLWSIFPPGHRVPQFLLAIGAWILSTKTLELRGHGKKESALFLTFLFFTHGFLIQWGIAMLDLPMLFFWGLIFYGMISEKFWLSGLGSGIIIASKSFNVIIFCAAAFPFIIIYHKEILFNFRKIIIPSILCLVIVLPFYIRTFINTGTPIFPILTCTINVGYCSDPENRRILLDSSDAQLETKDYYGQGRTPLAALIALARLPFPEKNSINNLYDYPLGFGWWITLLILISQFINWQKADKWTKSCTISTCILLVVWFLGSQQSRWLFVPMLISFLSVSRDKNPFHRKYSEYAGVIIVFYVFLASLMIKNAHPYIFSMNRTSVLNGKYKTDMEISSREIHLIKYRERNDIYYIDAPVRIETGSKYWILPFPGEDQ